MCDPRFDSKTLALPPIEIALRGITAGGQVPPGQVDTPDWDRPKTWQRLEDLEFWKFSLRSDLLNSRFPAQFLVRISLLRMGRKIRKLAEETMRLESRILGSLIVLALGGGITLAQVPGAQSGRNTASQQAGYWSDSYDEGTQSTTTWPGTWGQTAKSTSGYAPGSAGSQPTAPRDPKLASNLVAQCGVAFKAHQYTHALDLCRQAANMGDRDGIEGVAIIYREGFGQCSQAAIYYNMNQDTRPAAAAGLGEMYWLGCRDFPRDFQRARAFLESAAKRGFINAVEDLAWMDELGEGTPHNRAKAIQELQQVARHGDEWAKDVMIALQQPNAPPRFSSEQELGVYAADVRFAREMATLNQEEQRRAEALRRNAPPGSSLSCSIGYGCRYIYLSPLQMTLMTVPGSPWNHSSAH